MINYMEAIAKLEDDDEKQDPTDDGFTSRLASVSDYAFYVFKNVS